MMAMGSPNVDILGLTTVGGNGRLADSTRNALRLLEYLGRGDVPVHRGASRPIRGSFRYGYYYHGPAALGVRLPSPRGRPQAQRAAEYIADRLGDRPDEVVIAALGPLTNVAAAIRKEPRVTQWAREIVIMGGAVSGVGNVTPHAEFNTYNDPEAADYVLSSDANMTLVDLDVCSQVYVQGSGELASGTSLSERLTRRILDRWFASRPVGERYTLCDPLAIVALLRPELFSFRQASVAVDISDTERRGATSAGYGEGRVRVASAVQASEAREAMAALLRG